MKKVWPKQTQKPKPNQLEINLEHKALHQIKQARNYLWFLKQPQEQRNTEWKRYIVELEWNLFDQWLTSLENGIQ